MGVDNIKGYALAIGTLAAVTLVAMAVVLGYKDSNVFGNCSASPAPSGCSQADSFVTGLAIFGTFAAVIALALVGKIIVGLYKKGD